MTTAEILSRLEHVKKTANGWLARCPGHPDKTPSLCIKTGDDGRTLIDCMAGCTPELVCAKMGIKLADLFADKSQRNGAVKSSAPPKTSFDWPRCVAALTAEAKRKLADWRGLSPDFVDWLHREKFAGIHAGHIAFAVHKAGQIVGCHYLADRATKLWKYHPEGNGTHPLVFGDPASAAYVLCFESQWDAFAVMDKLSWHSSPPDDYAVIITRGAKNGKLIQGQCSPAATVYAFVQNDKPKSDGMIPAETWLATVAANSNCKVLRVTTPLPHKDPNDWTQAGATWADIESAIRGAKPITPAVTIEADAPNFATITADIRGKIIDILTDKNATAAQQRNDISNLTVDALCKVGSLFFHAELRDYDSALFFNAHTKRLERIRSDAFGAWLSVWLRINRADSIFKYAIAAVETAALSGPETKGILPENFWASRAGALYLSNGDGSAAKITAHGVEIVDNGSDGVLFAAGRTCAPWKLTQPQDIFETCAIFRNLHATAGHAPDLLRAWMYSLPTNPPCKPPLCLAGEVQSGKTRLAKAIAEFYGVPVVVAKVEETGEDDFWPACNAGGIYILDNADTRNKWLADAVANHSTDGCKQQRRLYTNTETVTLRARAWLCITTANPTFAADSGLADRLLPLRMARRDQETSDAALTAEVLAYRDAGLSHLVETLQKALADTKPTLGGLNARHPDFAAFAVHIGRGLNREAAVIEALKSAEADKGLFCLENDGVGAALLAFIQKAREFTGTAADLAPKLIATDKDLDGQLSAKRLGKRLSALWPHLQKALAVCRKETNRNGVTVFTFKAGGAGFAGFQSDF